MTDGASNTIAMSERTCHAGMPGKFTGETEGSAEAEEVFLDRGVATLADVQNNPIDCYSVVDGQYYQAGSSIRSRFGTSWQDGQPAYVGFNTVLPPNGPSCSNSGNWGDQNNMLIPPSSSHPGGVNAVFGDGSVHFISETIDTGDLGVAQPDSGPSVYGVWGAMGSKAGGDMVSGL